MPYERLLTRVTAERARHPDRRPRRQLVARSIECVFALARRLRRHGKPRERPGGSRDGAPTSPSTSGCDAHVRARLADAPETYRDPSAYDILGALGVGALGSVTLVRRRATDEAFALSDTQVDLVATDRVAVAARELAVMQRYDPTHASSTPRALPRRSLRLFSRTSRRIPADLLRRPRTRETPNPRVFILSPRRTLARPSRAVLAPNISATTVRHRPPRRETRKFSQTPRPRRPRRFRPRARRPRSERLCAFTYVAQPRTSPRMARGPRARDTDGRRTGGV